MQTPQAVLLESMLTQAPQTCAEVDALLDALDGQKAKLHPETRELYAELLKSAANTLSYPLAEARALIHLASSWSDRANYNRALQLHLRALHLAESTEDRMSASRVHNDMATVLFRMGRTDEASEHLEQAEQLAIDIGNRAMAATFGLNRAMLGITDWEQADAIEPMARPEYEELLQRVIGEFEELLAERPGDPALVHRLSGCHQALGRLHKYRPKDSLQHHKKSAELLMANGLGHRMAPVRMNIAEAHLMLRETKEAEEQYKLALELAEKAQDLTWLPDIYEKLSAFYETEGNAEQALNYQKLLHGVYRQIQEMNSKDQLEQLRTHFESERKAKDAEIHRLRYVELEAEKQKTDQLLHNILPHEVAEELKTKGLADARLFESVTVLFTDFKGFTRLSEQLSPKELVHDLHEYFSLFDHICEKYGIEKIKTIGDAYMAAGGLPTPNTTHAHDVVKAALEMAQVVEEGRAKKIAEGLPYFEIRIGIHTGPVVAGIVGIKKFQYDIWGDTVNTASRMESSGEVGKVNISETTYQLLKDYFTCEYRGEVEAKGKGKLGMYFVAGESSQV